MTTIVPRINVNTANVPDELILVSTRDREVPSWIVQLLVTHVTTPCGICNELIDHRARAYYEQGEYRPAHVECWMLQVIARDVRIIEARYRNGGSAKCVPLP